VAEGVVHQLEAVEIAEGERELALADGEGAGQAGPELDPVGHTGEGVVAGEMTEALVLGGADEGELHVSEWLAAGRGDDR
jgi:hypothetical protein